MPESVANPGLYFENNVLAALNVAEASLARGIKTMVHSSTCAVYGTPAQVPIDESSAHAPLSPYGVSKSMVENMLASFQASKGLKPLNLRYFNPAGALSGKKWGESHDGEVAGPYVTREAAFEAAVATASLALKQGHAIEVHVPLGAETN